MAGLRNFHSHYKNAVDVWALYDNSGEEPVLIEWGERVTEEQLSKARDKQLIGSLASTRRAARAAPELTVRTDTAIIVLRDGKMVRITTEELRKSGVR